MAKNSGKNSKTNSTWTVRGISPETRTAVRLAARKSGQTQGEWLEETLAKAARESASHSNVPAQQTEIILEKIMDRLEGLEADQKPSPSPTEARRGLFSLFRL